MAAASAASDTVVVGQRVADKKGNKGTVQYVGPVATSKSAATVYAGIEWDDATRGKNDGSVTKDGVEHRYFTCGPTSGSFMKLPLLDVGQDLLTALHERYVAAPDADIDTGGSGSEPGVHIIFVGNDHIRAKQQLGQLFNVSVKAGLVSGVGEGSELGVQCPHLTNLDMRESLLWSCGILGELGQHLKQLTTLNLGGNALQSPSPALASGLAGALPALEVLVLSGTGLKWGDICALGPAVPALRELHVCDNGLTDLEGGSSSGSGTGPFPGVTTLALNGNGLEWEAVGKLGTWPALTKLHVAGNAITAVGACPPGHFPALTAVTVSGNPLATWAALDTLDTFPGVSWLRAADLPVFEEQGMGPSVARMHVIARLPGLASLNGSEVRRRERADAEKSYLRVVADAVAAHCKAGTVTELFPALAQGAPVLDVDAWQGVLEGAAGDAVEWVAQHHPRFPLLSCMHRDSVPTAAATTGAGTLASNIVTVTLRSMAGASSFMKPVLKPLPLTLPVAQLAQVAASVFKMEDASLLRLSFRDSSAAFPTLMDNDLKPLSYFGVADGGEVLVEEVEAGEAARLAAEAAAATAAREEVQARGGDALGAAAAAAVAAGKSAAANAAGV